MGMAMLSNAMQKSIEMCLKDCSVSVYCFSDHCAFCGCHNLMTGCEDFAQACYITVPVEMQTLTICIAR